MKIAINTLSLAKTKVGMGKYIAELVNSIPVSDQGNFYFIYLSEENKKYFNLSQGNIQQILVRRIWTNGLLRIFWEQLILPFSLCWNKINTYHAPGFVLPLFRVNKNTKFVVTIADMTFFSHPEHHIYWKQKYFKCMIPMSIKQADHILAISENTKKDILEMIPVNKNKIVVTYLGYDAFFSKQNKTKISAVLQKWWINFPYILFVGMLEPRKNIPSLIKAFAAIKEKRDHKLVIVGKKGWLYGEIFALVQKLKIEEQVIFTGYVPDEDLPALYSAATCFVYPSFYEGFGIPIIEAMACGCPVITSNNSSMKEIAGDAAIVVDPYNVKEIQNAIELLITDKVIRRKMEKQGVMQAKKFSWEKMISKTKEVYYRTASA